MSLLVPRPTMLLTPEDLRQAGPPRSSGDQLRYRCPLHGGDHQRSLALNPATGLYYCHCCGVGGRLATGPPLTRVGWPTDPVIGQRLVPGPSPLPLSLPCRRQRERRARVDHVAAAFLADLPLFVDALRDPSSAGAVYLHGRGLDHTAAAERGAGYAPPGRWPGDWPGDPGRLVYPLADLRGVVVSALGRLCATGTAAGARAHRKLPGRPSGLWPGDALARARATGLPLVLLEGPSDVLAALAVRPDPPPLAALCGTTLPPSFRAALPPAGVVLALDDDAPGRRAARRLADALARQGVPVRLPPDGWLEDAADLSALAAAAVQGPHSPPAAALCRAADRLAASSGPPPSPA